MTPTKPKKTASASKGSSEFDDVLRKMLQTPPQPKTAAPKKIAAAKKRKK